MKEKGKALLIALSFFLVCMVGLLCKRVIIRSVDENGASISFDNNTRLFYLLSASHQKGYRLKKFQIYSSENMIIETFVPKKPPLSVIKKAKYVGVTFQPTVVPYSSKSQKDPFILSRNYDSNTSARDTLRILEGNKFNDCHILSANYPAISVRDPSIVKIGNKYFIIYTRGLLCTKDFNHWKKLPWHKDKEFNYSQDWAPEFVNKQYVVMSKIRTDYYNHQLYVITFKNGVVGSCILQVKSAEKCNDFLHSLAAHFLFYLVI